MDERHELGQRSPGPAPPKRLGESSRTTRCPCPGKEALGIFDNRLNLVHGGQTVPPDVATVPAVLVDALHGADLGKDRLQEPRRVHGLDRSEGARRREEPRPFVPDPFAGASPRSGRAASAIRSHRRPVDGKAEDRRKTKGAQQPQRIIGKRPVGRCADYLPRQGRPRRPEETMTADGETDASAAIALIVKSRIERSDGEIGSLWRREVVLDPPAKRRGR